MAPSNQDPDPERTRLDAAVQACYDKDPASRVLSDLYLIATDLIVISQASALTLRRRLLGR